MKTEFKQEAGRRCLARLVLCSFCGYAMDEDLGKYGCPNCHGEGLENKMKSSYLFSCATEIKGLL